MRLLQQRRLVISGSLPPAFCQARDNPHKW